MLIEFNGIHPKCICGYCDDDSTFNARTNTFVKINFNHKKFDWLKAQYIKNLGPLSVKAVVKNMKSLVEACQESTVLLNVCLIDGIKVK